MTMTTHEEAVKAIQRLDRQQRFPGSDQPMVVKWVTSSCRNATGRAPWAPPWQVHSCPDGTDRALVLALGHCLVVDTLEQCVLRSQAVHRAVLAAVASVQGGHDARVERCTRRMQAGSRASQPLLLASLSLSTDTLP